MKAYDFNLFSNHLVNWMTNRFLDPILYIEGGWEYWIQIDFPSWIDVVDRTQYDFRREVTGVLQNGRLDWLVNGQGSGGQLTAVEIKAQTHKYLKDRFVSDVRADVQKLECLGQDYHKIMLAAVIDPHTYDTLTAQGFWLVAPYSDTVMFLALADN